MTPTIICETERLLIREFNLDDDLFIYELLNSPGWLKFVGDRNIQTKEDARNYILNRFLPGYTKFGFGAYLVELKDSSVPIGLSCLIKRDTLEHVDLGFAFLTEYAGKGYAYEASLATLNYAQTKLELKHLVAITDTDNIKSINLLKRLGFNFEKSVQFKDEKNPLFLFSIIVS